MHDLPNEAEDKKEYECLKCGEIAIAAEHPVDCPECDGGMVGRGEALE